MGWKQKSDPVSERARALNSKIAALEAQIKKLNSETSKSSASPRLRSTAVPHGATVSHKSAPPVSSEPIFEDVDQKRLKSQTEIIAPQEHFNELGVRKYDLAGLLRRWKNHFRGPSTPNPQLVNYLAAGGVQGLRPMRYERRVARNRVIALAVIFLLVLLGLQAMIKKL
jgi:cell division protein FtsB